MIHSLLERVRFHRPPRGRGRARLVRAVLLILVGLLLTRAIPASAGLAALLSAEADDAAGRRTAAEAGYRRAVATLPREPAPFLRLASLYEAWGRPQDGLAALDEAVRRGSAPETVAPLRLSLLAQLGRWEMVEMEAEARLQQHPAEAPTLARLTRARLQRNRCAAAAESAARWRSAAPVDPSARLTWAALQPLTPAGETLDPLCSAAPELCAALRRCSTPDGCDLVLGQGLIARRQWGLAVCVLQRAVAAAPQSAPAHAWLGAAMEQGAVGDPLPHLQRATALDPDDPAGWLLLGTYQLRIEELNGAARSLERAYQLDPENPAPCLALMQLAARRAAYDIVEGWTAAALDRAEGDVEVWKTVARFYLERDLRLRDWPLGTAQQAVQLAPEDPEAHWLLGWARLNAADLTGALQSFDRALELDPQMAPAHALRGRALQQLGRYAEAGEAFTRAMDLGYRP